MNSGGPTQALCLESGVVAARGMRKMRWEPEQGNPVAAK